MPKYALNGRYLLHRITGVERYAGEIIAELDKIVSDDFAVLVIPPEVADDKLPELKHIKIQKVGRLHNRAWEHISFPIFAKQHKLMPVSFCNVAPLLYPGIVTVHDVKVMARPEYFSMKFRIWYHLLFSNISRRAKKIITVSEFSKREIMKYCRIEEERICVIPSAWNHYIRIGYDDNALNKYGLQTKNYFFAMSSFEPNKNFKWVATVARKNPDKIFAVAGSINTMVFQEGLGFDAPKNMKILGYVSDKEAKELMKQCKAFLFPTFYEGFGLPPLEALSAGAPAIVVSDTEVMHEIYDGVANFIDPNRYDYSLDQLCCPDETKITELLERFTWKQSARALYEKVLK